MRGFFGVGMGGSRQLSVNSTLDSSMPPRNPILCLAPSQN